MASYWETLAGSVAQNDGSQGLANALNAMDSYVKGVKARGDTLTQGFKDFGTGASNMMDTLQTTMDSLYANDIIQMERNTAIQQQNFDMNLLNRDRDALVKQTGFNSSKAYTKNVYDALNQNQNLRSLGITNMAELTGLINNPESIDVRAEILAMGDPDLKKQKLSELQSIVGDPTIIATAQEWEDKNNRFMLNEKGVLSPESAQVSARVNSGLSVKGRLQPESISTILAAQDQVRQAGIANIEAELSRSPYANTYSTELAAGYAADRKAEEAKRKKEQEESASKEGLPEWTPEQAQMYAQTYANLPADQQNAINQSVSFIERTQGKAASMKYFMDMLDSFSSGSQPITAATPTANQSATNVTGANANVVANSSIPSQPVQSSQSQVNSAATNAAIQSSSQSSSAAVNPVSANTTTDSTSNQAAITNNGSSEGYTTPNVQEGSPSLNTTNVFNTDEKAVNRAMRNEINNINPYNKGSKITVDRTQGKFNKDKPDEIAQVKANFPISPSAAENIRAQGEKIFGSGRVVVNENNGTVTLKDPKAGTMDQQERVSAETARAAYSNIAKIEGYTKVAAVVDTAAVSAAITLTPFGGGRSIVARIWGGSKNALTKRTGSFKDYYSKKYATKDTDPLYKQYLNAFRAGSHRTTAHIREFFRNFRTGWKNNSGAAVTEEGAAAVDAAVESANAASGGKLLEWVKSHKWHIGGTVAGLTGLSVLAYKLCNNEISREEFEEIDGLLAERDKKWEEPTNFESFKKAAAQATEATPIGLMFTSQYTQDLQEFFNIYRNPDLTNEEKAKYYANLNFDNIQKQADWLRNISANWTPTVGGGIVGGVSFGMMLGSTFGLVPGAIVGALVGSVIGYTVGQLTKESIDAQYDNINTVVQFGRQQGFKSRNEHFNEWGQSLFDSTSANFQFRQEQKKATLQQIDTISKKIGFSDEDSRNAQRIVGGMNNLSNPHYRNNLVVNMSDEAESQARDIIANTVNTSFGVKGETGELSPQAARAFLVYDNGNLSKDTINISGIKYKREELEKIAAKGGDSLFDVSADRRLIPLSMVLERYFDIEPGTKKKLNQVMFQNEEFRVEYGKLCAKIATNPDIPAGEINNKFWGIVLDAIQGIDDEDTKWYEFFKQTFDPSSIAIKTADAPGLRTSIPVDRTKAISALTQNARGFDAKKALLIAQTITPEGGYGIDHLFAFYDIAMNIETKFNQKKNKNK